MLEWEASSTELVGAVREVSKRKVGLAFEMHKYGLLLTFMEEMGSSQNINSQNVNSQKCQLPEMSTPKIYKKKLFHNVLQPVNLVHIQDIWSISKKYFDPSHLQSKKYFDPSHSQSKKYFDPSHSQWLVLHVTS